MTDVVRIPSYDFPWICPSWLFRTPAISGFPESSKFRVTNILWRSFVFLDEAKILSYCGPKEFLNCVIPVNGKLLSTLVFSDPLQGPGELDRARTV